MLKLATVDGSPVRTHPLLERIAKALDCPVEMFSEPVPNDAAQTAELMRLWQTIEHEQDRAKTLSLLRRVVGHSDAQQDH